MAPDFYTMKVITLDLQKHWSMINIYPLYHGISFYPSLLNFHLKIPYRKVRNLQIDVLKFVGKVSINFLHHTKPAAYIISIIIIIPAVAFSHVVV